MPQENDLDLSSHESWISFHHVTTVFAGSKVFRSIEIAEPRKKIFLDVIEVKSVFVKFRIAFITIPDKTIKHFRIFPFTFDY